MAKNKYTINLQRLPKEGEIIQETLECEYFEELDQEEILGGEVEAKVSVKPVGSSFVAQVSVKGEVDVECDRCLADLTLPVENSCEVVIKYGSQEQIDMQPDEDIVYVDADHAVFDYEWLLFEMIELSLPMVRRHQHGECNPLMEELLLSHLCTTEDDME